MDHTSYITKEGDRWDELAYRFLGDAMNIKPITDANPRVPLKVTLEGGLKLFIPIFENQAIQDFNNLPPWKRPQ